MKRHIYSIMKTKLNIVRNVVLAIVNVTVHLRYLEVFVCTVKQSLGSIQFIPFVIVHALALICQKFPIIVAKFSIFLIKGCKFI